MSGNVARELESVWLDLFAAGLDGEDSKVEGDDEGSKSGYVESKMIESAALAKLCEASFMVSPSLCTLSGTDDRTRFR